MFKFTVNNIYVCQSHALSSVAYNVPAVWRSGGFHYTCCGVITFNSPQNCLRGNAAIAPNRPLYVRASLRFEFSTQNNKNSFNIITSK